MTTDLPTVRAAIERTFEDAYWNDRADDEHLDAILATLSDPTVMDELARWLIKHEDGPFEVTRTNLGTVVWCRLRQRTRNEGT